jgi:hypothetical protein
MTRQASQPQTTILYRPTGEDELALIRERDCRTFPPRLFWQPIFYPVLFEDYARQIARNWNARDGKRGYVTRFAVETTYLAQFEIHQVGSSQHQEYWIPAEELDEFNQHIVGPIEVIAEYTSAPSTAERPTETSPRSQPLAQRRKG